MYMWKYSSKIWNYFGKQLQSHRLLELFSVNGSQNLKGVYSETLLSEYMRKLSTKRLKRSSLFVREWTKV